MPTSPPIRALVRPALLLLPLVALACPQPPPPTTPDLPQVSIVVEEPTTAGTSLKLSVSTSGCDQVQRLEILDNNELLKTVTFSGNPTPVELGMSEIRYTRGIAASLSLTANVTCVDGRSNVSQAQPATFFPVAESIDAPSANEQVVPNYFVAEGKEGGGSNVSFIGCVQEGPGRTGIYKVTKDPKAPAQRLEMLIPCADDTVITERRPAGTGWRWVWTPNQGLFALGPKQFDTNTLPTTLRGNDYRVDRLMVTPEGDALVYDEGEGLNVRTLKRITPAGETLWTVSSGIHDELKGLPNPIIGDIVLTGSDSAVVPIGDDFSSEVAQLQVGVLDYKKGEWIRFMDIETYGATPDGLPPPVAINPSGTLLFVATQNGSTAFIRACAISGTGTSAPCDPPTNRKWISSDLPGAMVALLPYADGSRLAAIAKHHTWFLNTSTGQVVNKDGLSISPGGALFPRQVILGGSNAFYLLTSGQPTTSQPTPSPVEIIATDLAERGELYRFQIPGVTLAGATDDSGALWLRVGRKLVKPLAPEQYRQQVR